ncbi:hypothetical protein NPIL_690871 [Nephila pilipes]|uniref:Uncharacterized protein n=1 Tax=Nephila pilipes TaxID=299642 RepID=A0A8X6P841_NEPPI|nr:hypothetical protein NPIL_690871 [Nephila pilipes]
MPSKSRILYHGGRSCFIWSQTMSIRDRSVEREIEEVHIWARGQWPQNTDVDDATNFQVRLVPHPSSSAPEKKKKLRNREN